MPSSNINHHFKRRCSFSFDKSIHTSHLSTTPSNNQVLKSPNSQCKVCKRFFKGRKGLKIHLGRSEACKTAVASTINDDSLPEVSFPRKIIDTVRRPSTSVESLEHTCGDGSNTKICKHTSNNGCKLCHHLSTKDHFVSTSTHRVYQAIIPSDVEIVNCNSSNVIYLITCKKCRLQYVGETVQKLRERRNHHDSCFHHPEKDNTSRILSEYFSKGCCKNATYSVHIVEKLKGNGRDENNVADPAVTSIRRKKETEWMLKLRTVFPYGLNDRVGDEYMTDRDSSHIASKFPTLKRTHSRHRVRTKVHTSSEFVANNFVYIVNESLRADLRNTMNLIRVLLSSLKKSYCRTLFGVITDYLAEKHDSFRYSQYFEAALDLLSCKLGKPPNAQHGIDKKPPGNRCHILFDNKAIDFINIQKIVKDKDIVKSLPLHLRGESPMVVFELTNSIHSKLFNYKKFVQSLDVDAFLLSNDIFPCECRQSSFSNSDHNHIITGNLDIVPNVRLRNLIAKGPKFREPEQFSYASAKDEILNGIDKCIVSWSNRTGTCADAFRDWREGIRLSIDNRIAALAQNKHKSFPVLKDRDAKNAYLTFKRSMLSFPLMRHQIM